MLKIKPISLQFHLQFSIDDGKTTFCTTTLKPSRIRGHILRLDGYLNWITAHEFLFSTKNLTKQLIHV